MSVGDLPLVLCQGLPQTRASPGSGPGPELKFSASPILLPELKPISISETFPFEVGPITEIDGKGPSALSGDRLVALLVLKPRFSRLRPIFVDGG